MLENLGFIGFIGFSLDFFGFIWIYLDFIGFSMVFTRFSIKTLLLLSKTNDFYVILLKTIENPIKSK